MSAAPPKSVEQKYYAHMFPPLSTKQACVLMGTALVASHFLVFLGGTLVGQANSCGALAASNATLRAPTSFPDVIAYRNQSDDLATCHTRVQGLEDTTEYLFGFISNVTKIFYEDSLNVVNTFSQGSPIFSHGFFESLSSNFTQAYQTCVDHFNLDNDCWPFWNFWNRSVTAIQNTSFPVFSAADGGSAWSDEWDDDEAIDLFKS